MAPFDSHPRRLWVVFPAARPLTAWQFFVHRAICIAITNGTSTFEEIAPIVKRTPAATRQLASRARRRVRGADAPATDIAQQRELVDAFLAASRDGDFERLVAVLSPDAVMRADDLAVRTAAANQRRGAPNLSHEVRGAASVADVFKGRAHAGMRATIGGEAGAVWAVGAQARTAFLFTIERGKIAGIDLIMNPERLAELEVELDA